MNNVTIQSSCGHTLLPGQTATLTAVVNNNANYSFVWQKKNLKGELYDNWIRYGTSIQITCDESSEDTIYVVTVLTEGNALTDNLSNILTDKSGNVLTSSFVIYTIEKDIYNAQENDEIIPFVEELTILLATRGKHIYGRINNIDLQSVSYKMNLNAANELSFTVNKTVDGVTEPLWDKIKDFRLVYVREVNEYYQIKVTIDDTGDNITKTISGTSLCEAELGQLLIHNTEINTEDDIARDDYVVTTFYNSNKKASLLDRVLSFAPHYKIGHVDETLVDLQRSFSIDDTSVYDFLTGDCAEQFNCLFQFDSTSRTINVYDLYTNCLNAKCGYRGEFDKVCPKCGGTKLSYFGEDTSIYVDSRNLSDSISFETDDDSVKNCFKIVGGDDDINAAIRNVNPNGTDIIYYITDDQKEEMSQELISKLDSYDTLYNDNVEKYHTLNKNIYEAYDKILYYTSTMMPTVEHEEVTAATEAAKLTVANLSPMGLQTVTTSTSVTTVNAGLKMLAKVFVKSGYVKVEIESDDTKNTFTYVGEDEQHNHYGTWYGRFKVTNYNNEEDVVYTSYMQIKVYDLYEEYLDQKIKKNIVSSDKDGEDSLFDVLTINSLDKFKEAIKLYCLNRLTSFKAALEGCVFTLVEADQAKEGADLYTSMYLAYLNKLNACEEEIDARQATIDDWQNKLDAYLLERTQIQETLNFEKFLGTDLYYEFIAYRREDTYSNDNYISDGLSNEELLDKAQELIETAEKELYKSATKQHSISSTLYNLFQLKEFAPLRTKFTLGNWMRILVDDTICRVSLCSYEVNYGGLENISVEFTDVSLESNIGVSAQSILAQAQQMATNYSYVSAQAKKGDEAKKSINTLLKNGLNASVTAIKSADTEDITIDKSGIKLRAYDDIYSDYSPKQAALIHNMFVFTKDNWRTAETALGEITYELNGQQYTDYGLISKIMVSGKMISGDIYSANFTDKEGAEAGTHIDLETGSFTLAGGKIRYTAGGNKITLKDVVVEYTTEEGKSDSANLDKVITGQQTTTLYVDQVVTKYMSTDSFYARFAEIDLAKIKELYADSAIITSLNATYVTADELKAKKGDFGILYVEDLAANVAKIDLAKIKELYSDSAFIKSLDATYVVAEDLKAKKGDFGILYADDLVANIAKINLLDAGTISADSAFIKSLQTTTTNTVTSTVDLEFVKDLIVGNATIQDLFTSNFTIGSDNNGTTVMNGSTMQFKDAKGNVYIQLGTDSSGGHSLIVKNSSGTTLLDGSGITKNAIADGLIVNEMVATKSSSYTGIGSDKLNIDSVEKTLNENGNLTMNVSKVYFDDKTQTLNTYLAQMKEDFSTEINNKIAENEVYKAWIESSNGNVLATAVGNKTTLKCVLQKGNDIIDANGTMYRYIWHRKTATGGVWDYGFNRAGKSITVSYNDVSEDYIYMCDIEDTVTLTDPSENILTDASSNILDAYNVFLTTEYTLARSLTEVLETKYYTKQETPTAVVTILAQTDITKVNGQENSILSRVNSTKETVDGFERILSLQDYKTFQGLITQVNSTKSTVDEHTTTITKAQTTADEALAKDNVNLLRNSDTLIFSDYIIGNILTDASGNILINASSYVMVS